MRCAAQTSPQQNAQVSFFFSAAWKKNAAQLKNGHSFRAGPHIAFENSQKAGNQTGSERHMIFAQGVA